MTESLGLLDHEWFQAAESKPYFMTVMDNNMATMKKYGFIDRPVFDRKIKEFQYKVILSGKSGCGKTSTVAKLTGHEIPKLHRETPGLEQTTVMWPARLIGSKEPVIFRLKLCDAGETCMSRFNHILPAMKENADAVLFFFSMVDRASFEDLPQQMSRILGDQTSTQGLATLIIATKTDQHGKSEVPQRDILELSRQYDIPVLRVHNKECTSITDIVPILNALCERLWYRDQQEAGLVI